MAKDERVFILGEDILDPYGGAFKVTSGLSSTFPKRVITTPISEAGIVGLAAGMALREYRPVVEIMFGDFFTLIADQLINHIAKFRWMYNDQVHVPKVVPDEVQQISEAISDLIVWQVFVREENADNARPHVPRFLQLDTPVRPPELHLFHLGAIVGQPGHVDPDESKSVPIQKELGALRTHKVAGSPWYGP